MDDKATTIDISDVAACLLPNAQALCESWLPGGKLKGHEWISRNPNRDDRNARSFSVNVQTGKWADFASGDKGGDLVSLYAYLNRLNQLEAAKHLNEQNGLLLERPKNGIQRTKLPGNQAATDLTLVFPVPDDAPPPPAVLFVSKEAGELKPDRRYEYLDAEGKLLHYVYRFNQSETLESKEIRPVSLWRDTNGVLKWHRKSFPDNRPLYGLHMLDAAPEKTVLMVSGEKCVDACRWQFKERYGPEFASWPYIPITWQGGDQGIAKGDFRPLVVISGTGRQIIYWPDNDDSCRKAMGSLLARFPGRMLPPPSDKPKGWDCADAVTEGIDLYAYIASQPQVAPSPPTEAKGTGKQKIYLSAEYRPEYLDETRRLFQEAGGVYQRGGAIVRVVQYDKRNNKGKVKTPDGLQIINQVSPIALAAFAERCGTFMKYDRRSNEWMPTAFPEKDAKTLIDDVHISGLPYLKSVVSSPVLRADGSILHKQGYDEETGLYLDTGGVDFEVERIPDRPTREDAQESIDILNELICKFPFVDDTDGRSVSRSVMLSAMLTTTMRAVLPTAPMVAFSAPVAGSGKSKLADIISYMATGKCSTIISYTPNEDEFKKGCAALLMQGSPVNCIDNINGVLKSDWLCQALTQTEVTSRVLGESRNVTTPTACIWLATGNNIEPQEDLTRRTLFCRIDPETDKADEREFDFEPITRLTDDWPRYYRAALTILKAYLASGRPKQRIKPYGSFEAWSDTVRSALLWAGEPDPCANRAELESGDTAKQSLRALAIAWWNASGLVGNTCSTKELIAKAKKHEAEELLDALDDVCGRKGEFSSRALGTYLKRKQSTMTCTREDGTNIVLRIREAFKQSNKFYYKVEEVVR